MQCFSLLIFLSYVLFLFDFWPITLIFPRKSLTLFCNVLRVRIKAQTLVLILLNSLGRVRAEPTELHWSSPLYCHSTNQLLGQEAIYKLMQRNDNPPVLGFGRGVRGDGERWMSRSWADFHIWFPQLCRLFMKFWYFPVNMGCLLAIEPVTIFQFNKTRKSKM